MAYVKTTWQTGDVITAEKLNNMEGGIENATPLIVTETVEGTVHTLSETAKTIYDTLFSGRLVLLVTGSQERQTGNFYFFVSWQYYNGEYSFDLNNDTNYTATNDDDYPSYDEGQG